MKPNLKNLLLNTGIILASLCTCFIFAEIYFRFFFIRSDGLGLTLANIKWIEKYWRPINSHGYRDKEWNESDLKNKKLVVVVGDSIAAGHGIENVADRFSDILAQKLGPDYRVLNISKPGWGIQSELSAVYYSSLFPLDTIVWSYFPNDIIETAKIFGKEPPDLYVFPSGIVGKVLNKSYFLNFIYWNTFRILNVSNDYFEWIHDQYSDPVIWDTHIKELNLLPKVIKKKEVKKTIIVLFPFLTKEEESSFITEKVKEHFMKNQIEVLDVSQITKKMDKKDIIVSKVDYHPSVKLHKLVAEKLYEILEGKE